MASSFNTSVRVYTQATRNVNDSISFFNVADVATSSLKNILDRLGELATQASNGVMTDPQRQALDQESQALQQEYGRILNTASYNGTNVFTVGTVATQAGFGPQAVILSNIPGGSYTGTITTFTTSTITTTTTTTSFAGDGTFRAGQTFNAGLNTDAVATADFNGDGKMDLVTGNHWDSTLSVLLGNGNGTFQNKQDYSTGSGTLGHGPFLLAVIDFNSDGKGDLVTANSEDSTVSVLLANGNGTFQAKQSYGAGSGSSHFAVADCNGDGKSDLVTANGSDTTVSVLLGNGNGTFQARQSFGMGAGASPSGIAAADLNGDGKSDLVFGDWNNNSVGVLLGNGNGTFQARQDFGASRRFEHRGGGRLQRRRQE